ncbi:MAG: hypothetical protein ABSE64_14845 [Vulcanimicrobiaceae bacterium]
MKPPDVVQRVMVAYAANLHGVIGMQRHFSTLIDAGIVKHAEQSDSVILFKDGVFAQLHYYHVLEDGKEFSADQLTDRDKQSTDAWSSGKAFFKEPYDRRFAPDYSFAVVSPCTDCATGNVAVKFESVQRDEQHGSGTMWIDTAHDRVVKLTYSPYVLPSKYATSGTVTETSGSPLANFWYVVRIDESYRGRMVLISGTGTFTGLFDNFERFGSVVEGASAIREGTIGTAKP